MKDMNHDHDQNALPSQEAAEDKTISSKKSFLNYFRPSKASSSNTPVKSSQSKSYTAGISSKSGRKDNVQVGGNDSQEKPIEMNRTNLHVPSIQDPRKHTHSQKVEYSDKHGRPKKHNSSKEKPERKTLNLEDQDDNGHHYYKKYGSRGNYAEGDVLNDGRSHLTRDEKDQQNAPNQTTSKKSHKTDKTSNKYSSVKKSPKQSFRLRRKAFHHRSVQHGKKISAVESPAKRLNKKLIQLVGELRRNCKFYKNELQRLKEEDLEDALYYQKENEILNQELYNMNLEVEEWKKRCKKVENRNAAVVKLRALENENREIKEDLELFKSVICRLNKEMSFYQDKLSSSMELFPQKVPVYSTSSPSSEPKGSHSEFQSEDGQETSRREINQWLRKPQRRLFPLLVAYDEAIKEKNDTIKKHEEAMDRFKQKAKEVVRENKDLHELVVQRKERGTVSIEEWELLHANSLIVLEENDLLHEQISNLKLKDESMIKSHQEKVSKLKNKISLLENEQAQVKSAAAKTEKQCQMLIEQHSRLAEIIEKRVPVEQHEASVMECKKLFEELKIQYGDERSVLMEKLASAEKERDRLVDEVAELEAKNGRLQANLKTCEEALTVNAVQFKDVYNRMIDTAKARDATTSAMEEMMELSQRVVSERENTEQLLNEQRCLNEKLILLRQRECELVGELQSKIKDMEDIHQEELDKLVQRIRELENIIQGIGNRHKEEMLHLEEMVHEKAKRIGHLEIEKNQLQADLETVWKTTTCTMKDITKKSSQNLQEAQ